VRWVRSAMGTEVGSSRKAMVRKVSDPVTSTILLTAGKFALLSQSSSSLLTKCTSSQTDGQEETSLPAQSTPKDLFVGVCLTVGEIAAHSFWTASRPARRRPSPTWRRNNLSSRTPQEPFSTWREMSSIDDRKCLMPAVETQDVRLYRRFA
jgi:hypothetical protein